MQLVPNCKRPENMKCKLRNQGNWIVAVTVILVNLFGEFSGLKFQKLRWSKPRRKLTQKVALMVKNNECDVTYVLKEQQRHSKCVIHKS
jgi:hypothetical protein